ncbi:MAG: ABC transporter permease subunit [Clostridium sp.]|jgi:osmoprotectant transport system permease protein|uniref:ABC transporter permease/substrate-binding protein n=1 Tax=Clostridium sp. TaxID=1506 RepID=UPI0025C3A985|nr:glycine betaine ABC transporter substrate-binding protein [Clostridium sp.]MCH3963239.1 ABC transporter permease subunit [Clostridium sp.]MCI1717211.1 ABC transporter permease subunit [Clostridium sp.]MCI1801551.1 ABC transporter permease subunit [Clostridium sp.]MCI1815397.1 ABC transporter permease subunit [Clostridium sp.]MCI1872300.1 ABC transporter permease subunit [Clostridium sp.]
MNSIVEFFNFVANRSEEILKLFFQHIELTLLAVVIAVLIGVPLGILIEKNKKISSIIIGIANIIQAIPSLALLGFLIPVIGIGSKPAVVMVILYSLLPIIKNTYTGLVGINPNIIEAAEGMGMTEPQILKIVKLPLALPVIMAGIRISAVTAVGLMTIAAFVGAGGLGYMVFTGVQSVNNDMILSGAIPACILALIIDFSIGSIEKSVTRKKRRKRKSSLKYKSIAAFAICIIIVLGSVFYYKNSKDTVVVGGRNFTEQTIMVYMVGELIEKNSDVKVEYKPNLGGTNVMFNAMKSGNMDIGVEYTGTAFMSIMKRDLVQDSDKVYRTVKDYYKKNFGIEWLEPIGFNNTYTLAVSRDTSGKYGLNTMSDLAKISNDLRLSCTMDFRERPDALKAVEKVYGINFKDVKGIDGGLRYTALNQKESDVIDAFSTDGLLKQFDLKILKDDKGAFPPYYAVPTIRSEVLKKNPELKDILNKLAGKIDDETMMELNYKVDSLGQKPEAVADQFLREKKLVK